MHNAAINTPAVRTSNLAGISDLSVRDVLLNALTVSSEAVDAITKYLDRR